MGWPRSSGSCSWDPRASLLWGSGARRAGPSPGAGLLLWFDASWFRARPGREYGNRPGAQVGRPGARVRFKRSARVAGSLDSGMPASCDPSARRVQRSPGSRATRPRHASFISTLAPSFQPTHRVAGTRPPIACQLVRRALQQLGQAHGLASCLFPSLPSVLHQAQLTG